MMIDRYGQGMRPLLVAACAVVALAGGLAQTSDLPNPYRVEDGWAKLPEGRTWGSTSAVDIDPRGDVWVAERCGANSCAGSDLAPVIHLDRAGKPVTSFGGGMFVFPHGFHVDREGNVWVTDGQGREGKGHQVIKFSPEGKVLLRLGKAGVAGDGPDTFNQPSDVVVTANSEILVADGHGGNSNARIVRFAKDGTFLGAWGRKGSGPGEFDTPHAIALDSKGRIFVGDRGNNRIQVFDTTGKYLEEWKQFGRPSGLYIDRDDRIYVADSESNAKRNPGWKRGIRIGSAGDGKVTAFIPDPEPNPDSSATSAAEGVAADREGNVYGAEVGPKGLKRYVKR